MAKKMKTAKAKKLAEEIARMKKRAAALRRRLAASPKVKKKASRKAQRAALAKGREEQKVARIEEQPPVKYRGYEIVPRYDEFGQKGHDQWRAVISKGGRALGWRWGATPQSAIRAAKDYIKESTPSKRAKKKAAKKVSYAARARALKKRPKKKGKKNRAARLGAAAKPSRARQRPGEGFAYLVQVQDSNPKKGAKTATKKKTRKNPDPDSGTASPARARQIAGAFLRSVG